MVKGLWNLCVWEDLRDFADTNHHLPLPFDTAGLLASAKHILIDILVLKPKGDTSNRKTTSWYEVI